jgi:hypothetical protein
MKTRNIMWTALLAAALALTIAACDALTGTTTDTPNLAVTEANGFKSTYAGALTLTEDSVTLADKPEVERALAAYEALSAEAKARLTGQKDTLEALLDKIADIEATAFRAAHAAALDLTVDGITIATKDAAKTLVTTALTAYNGLDSAAKGKLADKKELLDSLKDKIAELEGDVEESAADLGVALGGGDDITVAGNKVTVTADTATT